MAVKAFRKLLIGKEAALTPGTLVPATTYLRMSGTLEDQREIVFPDEDTGFLCKTERSYTNSYGTLLAVESPMNFEQVCYILNMGIKGVDGVKDGAGDGYIYDYPFPTTAANTLYFYTIEAGDDAGEEETGYCFVESFTISGAPQEPLKISANIIGRTAAPSTYTGGLSLPAIEECLFQKSKLYINDVSSAFGTTQATNTFLGFTLTVKTGWQKVYTGDGSMDFSFVKCVGPETELGVTFEHNATSVGEKVKWRAETPRAVRIICEGSTFGNAGTVYSKKTAIIDVAGKWLKFDKIDERDGNDIVTGTLTGRYDSTLTSAGGIKIVNALSALP